MVQLRYRVDQVGDEMRAGWECYGLDASIGNEKAAFLASSTNLGTRRGGYLPVSDLTDGPSVCNLLNRPKYIPLPV